MVEFFLVFTLNVKSSVVIKIETNYIKHLKKTEKSRLVEFHLKKVGKSPVSRTIRDLNGIINWRFIFNPMDQTYF